METQKKIAFWKKTIFYENIKKTIAVFGAPGVVGLHEFGAADHWMIIAGSISMLGAVLAIWATDNDKDGVVDFLQW